MLDGAVPERVDMIWGFAVQTRSSGRRKWPEELRAMAVERIAADVGIREIAEEIGANKSLVAVWVKNAQRESPCRRSSRSCRRPRSNPTASRA